MRGRRTCGNALPAMKKENDNEYLLAQVVAMQSSIVEIQRRQSGSSGATSCAYYFVARDTFWRLSG